MIRATFIKDLKGWRSKAKLYRLSKPVAWTDHKRDKKCRSTYVVVSAVYALTGPETLIFPADADGEPVSFIELWGRRGKISHETAIELVGWELDKPELRAAIPKMKARREIDLDED